MRVRAFAKINRSLQVLGVRPDGFHELRTVFQSIALHDTLTIRAVRGPFRFTCDDPDCPSDGTNLVCRAAAQLWRVSGHRGALRNLSIDLAKRIPVQAGLGGGSSDAAAVLRALGRSWRVDAPRLRAIAARIGADVPYFLEGGTVLGLERGDLLFRLVDAPPAWVVLAIPSFGISTQAAYRWFDADKARRLPASGRGSPKGFALPDRTNDLQGPVARRHPEITRLVRVLSSAGASEAAMSGSGSAVFGLFSTRRAAIAAAGAVVGAGVRRGTRMLITRTVDRAASQALAAK
jgi:4-diphosphocytidyl-2-C-methyl-D-erythritol kinase